MGMKGRNLPVHVECYAGYKAEEKPLRFSFPTESGRACRVYQVEEVLDQWYGTGDQWFRVRADDGNVYVLQYRSEEDAWSLQAFRRDSISRKPMSEATIKTVIG